MKTSLLIWSLFPVLIVSLCKAEVVKERIFVADDISTEAISVNIRSEITGNIKWTYTNDDSFIVKVKIVVDDETEFESTKLDFLTSNSTITLFIDKSHASYSYEPKTGSGSSPRVPVYLLFLPALLFGFSPTKTLIFLLLLGAVTVGETNAFNNGMTVDIRILAPLHYQYKEVNLTMKDGNIEYTRHRTINNPNLTCQTSHHDNSCPQCCYGNGACVQGTCVCNSNFTKESNCEFEASKRMFFSHPVDPRLDMTELQNGDQITLSYLFNFLQQQPYLKDIEKLALNFRSRLKTDSYSNIIITFHSDGFVNEIIDQNIQSQFSKIKLRRLRSKQCIVRVKNKKTKFDVDICDSSRQNILLEISPTISSTKTIITTDVGKSNPILDSQKFKYFDYYGYMNFSEVSVRTERCGYESMAKKHVFCKLSLSSNSPKYNSDASRSQSDIEMLSDSYLQENSHESVTLLTQEKHNGGAVLRLPESTKNLNNSVTEKKCELTYYKRQQICNSSYRQVYRLICKTIYSNKNGGHSAEVTSSHLSSVCNLLSDILSGYCDTYSNFEESLCTANYREVINLFSASNFHIRPSVLYSDNKIVTGSEHNIVIGRLRHEEMTIVDTTAEFKIVKISVIPSDPVPHDIYQVRMDYECATKSTVVNMTISGSDLYSNHMTCRGITSCNCCVVHAAGAPNAVIDHVIIKVTDESYGFSLEKETVIVF
ncbi:hypothetical protein ACF0H5_020295 [Mactra antiquata]